ncbi:MAG: LysR family transcriptional regulator [Dehalococcoidia bacterium]
MNLSPQSLESLVSVINHRSYTRAAEALSRSQPGVYQHIRQLERELGTKLVEQNGKQVVATEHGRAVYAFALRQHAEEEDLVRYLADDASLRRGQVRVAAGTTSAEFILPTIAVAFRRRYPGIELHLAAFGTIPDVDGAVARRTIDLGMHSAPAPAEGVVKTPFLSDALVGLARRDHPLADTSEVVTPERLAREPMVHFGYTNPDRARIPTFQAQVNNWFARAGFFPDSPLTIGTIAGMKRAVKDGGGVAIISRYAVDVGDPDLVTFELQDAPKRDFVLVSPTSGWESSVVRTFREFVLGLEWVAGDKRGFEPATHESDVSDLDASHMEPGGVEGFLPGSPKPTPRPAIHYPADLQAPPWR